MMIKSLNIILLFIFISVTVEAQISRTEAMGGLTFSIIDEDQKLDPFMFGGNPAYLWQSRKSMRLDITQFNNADYGDYRRKFSSERNFNTGANVLGVQPLGKSGTFQGKAYYFYNKRSNVYRTLKHDTYAGEAFYFTDTTSGDVIFNGPLFEFSHSVPVTNKLNFGAVFGYGLLNGLKKVYTYGETVYRNVYGKAGITYAITDNLTLGADYEIFDIRERITASDVNLFTVITYHYRGDTHRIELSGSKQKYTIEKHGSRFGGQIYFTPDERTQIGIKGNYSTSDTKSIFPISGLEVTDGYSWFRNYSFEVRARYSITKNFIVSAIGNYVNRYSWSENAKNNLLLWEWATSNITGGIGISSQGILRGLTFGFEYRLGSVAVDSSKYIDNSFTTLSSINHDFRFGFEYEILKNYFVRVGFDWFNLQNDFVFGGKNVVYKKITAGFGIKLNDFISLNLYGNFGNRENLIGNKREFWDARLALVYMKF